MSESVRGFTLVELLVSITIVVILATIGITIYSQAQKSARFNRRLADLKALQSAIETYRTERGKYPDTEDAWYTECTISGMTTKAPSDVVPGLVSEYLPVMPKDPQMNTTAGTACYVYRSDKNNFKVLDWNVTEITTNDLKKNPSMWDPAAADHPEWCGGGAGGNRRLAVYSDGARCW